MATNLTDYSNKSIGSGLSIPSYSTDNSTVLNLFGQGVNNYSSSLFENFIYLLSNFSSPFPPGTNFTDNYQSNNNWIPSSSSILKNTKTLMAGQAWFQSPKLPIMSSEVYNLVYQLVNSSSLTSSEITTIENTLLDIYQNSTSFQNKGCLWILNAPVSTTVTPLTYSLTGVGNIQVFDITQLGWEQVYPLTINDISSLNLTNDTSSLNFYTSGDSSTLTASIIGSSGVDNKTYSGDLSLYSGNLNLNSTTTLELSSGLTTTLTSPNILVTSDSFELSSILPTTDNSQKFATTAFVKSILSGSITSDGGNITGILTVPDPTDDESKQVANAEYVNSQIAKLASNGKTKIVSVLDYIGSDNDISPAVSKIISDGFNYIYIPDGTYLANESISINSPNLTVFGNGNDSIIQQTFNGNLFNVTVNNVTIKNIYVETTISGTSGAVVNSSSANSLKIDNIFIDNTGKGVYNGIVVSGGTNIKIFNTTINGTMGDGIDITNVEIIDISDNTIYDCGMSNIIFNGLTIDSSSSNISIRNNNIGNSSLTNEYIAYGLVVKSNNVVLISNNILYQTVSGMSFLKGPSVVNIGNIVY